MDAIYEEILAHVSELTIIDTHEHLPCFEDRREKETDILREYLSHYFSRDLVSAGLKIADLQKVMDHGLPIMARWTLVEPYWEAARNTGYGRALDLTVRDLYGADRICRATIEGLDEAFQRTLGPGHFQKVLKDKSRIAVSLLNVEDIEVDQAFFRLAHSFDDLVCPTNLSEVERVEQETGIRICAFDDWLEACERRLDLVLRAGAVALKSGLAYERILRYDRVTKSVAEAGFDAVFAVKHQPAWEARVFQVGKACQDYIMHYILRLANRRHLTVQFHTGLQEGSGNLIGNSEPSLLSNLFLDYPEVDFDLFHIGYPYQHVLSALAKNFPNVYIDMCWAHIISPTACVQALVEWLDVVPANKISAFGGDYCFIDAVYSHQYLARVDVSKALAEKVRDGSMDIARAGEIAGMLFYDNPLRIFKLAGKI